MKIFNILHTSADGKARTGIMELPHGSVHTPVFMPVGTCATVKAISKDDLEEIGSWIDYRTDCLGFRLQVAYAHDYKRIDGSEYEHDWRVGFFVYLRAFGPNWGSVLGD